MIRFRAIPVLAAFASLAACADPLSDFDRLSDVPLADGPAASVVPGAADSAGAPLVLPELLAGIGSDDDDGAAETTPTPVAAPRTGFFGGLFGGSGGAPTGTSAIPGLTPASVVIPGAEPLPPGSAIPYGVLATVCGLPTGSMGTLVASASGYAIYDTNPATTGTRTQYVTGFEDGCARQFTAALALFGDIGTHELVRYSEAAGSAYTTTDRAYEQIKTSYCGVPDGIACGERLDALSQRTTFLTVYQSFGSSNGWADILLSDGRVVADDF